jgi:hypothetical protein
MGIGIFSILLALICLVTLPFWILSIVDILKSTFKGNDKIIWLLVVVFLYLLGVILYRLIGKKQKIAS